MKAQRTKILLIFAICIVLFISIIVIIFKEKNELSNEADLSVGIGKELEGSLNNQHAIWNADDINIIPDTSNKVVSSYEEYDSIDYPLIAALPSEHIQLYGVKPEGVVLFKDGIGQFFDWVYMTPIGILPELMVADFNDDGIYEIAINLYSDSGSGISIEQLHILEASKDNLGRITYVDNQFIASDYIEQLMELLEYEYDPDRKTLVINVQDESFSLPCDDNFQSLVCGNDISHFEFENGNIKAIYPIGAAYDNMITVQYDIGSLVADVIYEKGKFILTDAKIDKEIMFPTLEKRNQLR